MSVVPNPAPVGAMTSPFSTVQDMASRIVDPAGKLSAIVQLGDVSAMGHPHELPTSPPV